MTEKLTKRERAERTRALIIEEAIKLFAKKGFASTSTKDLSTAIGMTQGALYWHFEDKDALLTAVLEELQRRLAADLTYAASTEAGGDDAPSGLLGIVDRVARITEQHQELMLVVGVIGAEATDVSPKVERALQEAYCRLSPLLEPVLEHGKQQGYVDAALDVPCAAQMWMGMYMGGLMHQRLFRQAYPLSRALPSLRKMLFAALMPKAAVAEGRKASDREARVRRRAPLTARRS